MTSPFSSLPQPLREAFVAQMRAEIVEHLARELFSQVFDHMMENSVDLETAIRAVGESSSAEWNSIPLPPELADVPMPPEVEEDLKATMADAVTMCGRISRLSFTRMEKLVSLGRGEAPADS